MKKCLLFFITTISFAELALAISPMSPNCGLHKNSRQIAGLQEHFHDKGFDGLFHNVALVGDDDREIISQDPRSEEAQLANRIGSIYVSQGDVNNDGLEDVKSVGTGQLVSWKGKTFFVASAHSFYDLDGNPKYDSKTASWSPNSHYYGLNENVAMEEYTFKIDALNLATLKGRRTNQMDVAIFEIDQSVATDKVFGFERGASELSSKSTEDLWGDIGRSESVLIAEHANFHNSMEVGISRNCQVKRPTSGFMNKLGLHSCDTGPNSSGTGIYIKEGSNYVLGGLHVFGRGEEDGGDFTDQDFDSGSDSNRFLPIDSIRQQFELLESEGKI